MARDFTAAESSEHNRCFEEACRLVKGEFHFDGHQAPSIPDSETTHRLQRAAALFERTLEINPENVASLFSLARVRLRLGDKEGSLRLLLRAQEVSPFSPGVARDSIMVALDLGQLNRAIDIARAGLTRMPEDPGILFNLGLVLLCSGCPQEAESAFSKAADLEPENPITPKLVQLCELVAIGRLPPVRTERDVAMAVGKLSVPSH